MSCRFLPGLRFSSYLCSVKLGGGFPFDASGNMKKEFYQECWEFLWCPKGNTRALEADERGERDSGAQNNPANSCNLISCSF